MKRSILERSALVSAVAALFCLGFAAPLIAAEPAASGAPDGAATNEAKVAPVKPAEKCLSDMRAFDNHMDQDGYWRGGSGYGYGYPMAGFGFGPPMMAGRTEGAGIAYQNTRPGYELRTLIAAANILARQGRQQPCEDVLAISRAIYKEYVADIHSGKMPPSDLQSWRQQQIAAAQPVSPTSNLFRSDEFIGTEVRSPHNDALGSVANLVMNPQTFTIAYVVIAQGGLFGIDEKYVPVPWDAFKVAPNEVLLVLDATTDVLDSAPQINKGQLKPLDHFDQLSQKVDTYWKTQLSDKEND